MSEMNLSAMTVIELRKLAKEMKVPLGAGISKQGIVEKLTAAMSGDDQAAPAAQETPAAQEIPALQEAPAAQDAPAAQETPAAQEAPATPAPSFRQAYTAPPRFNNKPAYQASAYGRNAAQRTPAPMETQRTQTTRPVGFTPRFGPAAHEAPAAPAAEETRPVRPESQRPAYSADRRPAYGDSNRYQQRQPAYEQRQPAYEQRQPAYEQRQPAYEQRQGAYEQRQPTYEQRPNAYPRRDAQPAENAVPEILSPAECLDGRGVLELHPDGYGFLRSATLLPSARDIYVAAAQIRRFGLRSGDMITGKVRPQRDGDKYAAMLYITDVNSVPADNAADRPLFEELTPVYPTRRIRLEGGDRRTDLRLIDLVTPIGFGQRGLILCPPDAARVRILTRLANVITENHPQAEVVTLLFNKRPEDVTLFRESVKCSVVATTFEMPAEYHLRLTDMVLDRAMRQAESGRDVVLLVDSLTTLTKVYTAAAMQQQGRTAAGVNPNSLYKAKKLFGAARCLREGGSLTVIATMAVDNGSRVDDSVVNEFRGAANMELVLDGALGRAGVYPPVDLIASRTRRAETIMTPAHAEGLKMLRGLAATVPAASAVPELIALMEKTDSNDELLLRLKDWIAAMKK